MSFPTRRRVLRRAAAAAAGVVAAPAGARDPGAATPPVDARALVALREALDGSLVAPDDEAYALARRVFYTNPRTATAPRAIVRCATEDDVARGIGFARRHRLEIAVRAGGHAHLAWGSSDGLVLDLTPLKRVVVDPERRVAHVGAGALGGEVARACAPFGLVPVLGQCPGVGATGVTLGGGLGWLSGLFGASCDNLVAARIVTADARLLDVDADTAPDLLWGLRGAGANFGVATTITLRLHPLSDVLGGDVHYSAAHARQVVAGFGDLMAGCPDAFQATLNLTPGPRGLFASFCHAGDARDGERLLEALRRLAPPTREAVRRQPFADLAEKAAATNPGNTPAPVARAIETVYRERIDDDLIGIIVDRLARAAPETILGLSHFMHGAVCTVDPAATAFPHRQAHSVHLRLATTWTDPAESAARFAEGEEWLRLLRPARDERIYANYQTYAAPAGAAAIYGVNHPRLAALKARHDPDNLFRRNANVPPASG